MLGKSAWAKLKQISDMTEVEFNAHCKPLLRENSEGEESTEDKEDGKEDESDDKDYDNAKCCRR